MHQKQAHLPPHPAPPTNHTKKTTHHTPAAHNQHHNPSPNQHQTHPNPNQHPHPHSSKQQQPEKSNKHSGSVAQQQKSLGSGAQKTIERLAQRKSRGSSPLGQFRSKSRRKMMSEIQSPQRNVWLEAGKIIIYYAALYSLYSLFWFTMWYAYWGIRPIRKVRFNDTHVNDKLRSAIQNLASRANQTDKTIELSGFVNGLVGDYEPASSDQVGRHQTNKILCIDPSITSD